MEFLTKLISFFSGKKTYLVALSLIVSAIWPFIQGDITLGEVFTGDKLQQILEGLGLWTLRVGVKKSGPSA